MIKTQSEKLYKEIYTAVMDRTFLKNMSMSSGEMQHLLEERNLQEKAALLLENVGTDGRFRAETVAGILSELLADFGGMPEEGWMSYAYGYVLGQLFPESRTEEGEPVYESGTLFFLRLLQTLYKFERTRVHFDPTVDIWFPRISEIEARGRLLKKNKIEDYI